MKKTLLIFIMLQMSSLCFGQSEIVLYGGNQDSILKAIAKFEKNNEGYGTIIVTNNISIYQDLEIPSKVTLQILTGKKLILNNGIRLKIKGQIISTKNQIFDTPELNHKIRIYNQTVFPEWFGLISYQKKSSITKYNNDSPAIQKSINSLVKGGEIFFTGNEYYIASTIYINTPSINLKGKQIYFSGLDNTNNFIATNSGVSSIFLVGEYGVRFKGLNFEGYIPNFFLKNSNLNINKHQKGENTINKAISFIRNNLSKDLDGEVISCSFKHFKNCIYGEGANLNIFDNTFTASFNGVYIQGAEGQIKKHYTKAQIKAVLSKNLAHTRGHRISRNRFHSIGSNHYHEPSLINSSCIKIESTPFNEGGVSSATYYVRGFYNEITDNYADDCRTFFEGIIDKTKIDGNSILFSSGTAIKATGGYYGSIINNIIDGSFSFNPHKFFSGNTIDIPSGHGIHIKFAHSATIHNNQILNKRFHGVYIERSINSSIKSNIIKNFNRHSFIKLSGEDPKANDPIMYDGIHIEDVSKNYNINNIVTNNTISITHSKLQARYGIFIGDGDMNKFIKNNFILPIRLVESVKIEK